MRKVTVAATQMAVTWNREESIKNADKLVRQAAAKGAQVILIQELFETPYFCQTQDFKYLDASHQFLRTAWKYAVQFRGND